MLLSGLRFLALALLVSCASNRYLNSAGHGAFLAGHYESAANLFGSEINKSKDNRLLFLLDTGTSYFNARQFDKALPFFLEAVKFWESKDYTSVSEEVAKMAISENLKTYIGEDFERILIHVYLALSYIGIDQLEEAQVEARRIDELLKQMREKEKKPYKDSAFARWLSGFLWEASGEYDSARIDYSAAYNIDPSFVNIQSDLKRSKRLGDRKEKPLSELVIFLTYGLSPVKVPRQGDSTALPFMFPRPWTSPDIEVSLASKKIRNNGQLYLNIEDLNRKFFNEKLAWLSARKVINLGIKGGLAYAVARSTKSEELGWLTFIALSAMDTTDLRGWNTLPAGLRVLRIPVNPGFHSFKIDMKSPLGEVIKSIEVKDKRILPGKKAFLVLHAG